MSEVLRDFPEVRPMAEEFVHRQEDLGNDTTFSLVSIFCVVISGL